MAKRSVAERTGSLDGRAAGGAGISIVPAAPAHRLALRADPSDAAALSKALAVELPLRPKTSASAGGRTALWLGPDEWLVIDEARDPVRDLAKARITHSAVDIAHRNTAILLAGRNARAVLEAGCPQDLSDRAFPVGACSRTVFGKIEVVILRTGEESFRLEVWRSFSDYAFAYLAEAARDAGA